ncbi:hypothetical protein [Clostridium folliculivorans]|uniref:Uncharacterized protein n=1 Tax=Clostridium folliculivorans TaxID=2886038 RepID=A0A9W5Y427_9CLOT|nr:hypothetical protein [Clostridium folliculivorans]GKU26278.1 hypothetical protein CFOLD11_31050 [Clostridium folliculivorans]GKU31950.1 hypothetical protein CFB3_40580 [Clostridium folliculivorans]
MKLRKTMKTLGLSALLVTSFGAVAFAQSGSASVNILNNTVKYNWDYTKHSDYSSATSNISWAGKSSYWVVTQATKYSSSGSQLETGYDYGYYSAGVSLQNALGSSAKFNFSVQPYDRNSSVWWETR